MAKHTIGLHKGEEIMLRITEDRWADHYNDVFITKKKMGKFTHNFVVSERCAGNEIVEYASFGRHNFAKALALAERLVLGK
jgi:hypothetical protein